MLVCTLGWAAEVVAGVPPTFRLAEPPWPPWPPPLVSMIGPAK